MKKLEESSSIIITVRILDTYGCLFADKKAVLGDRKNDQDVPYRFGWNKLDFGNDHWPVVMSTAT